MGNIDSFTSRRRLRGSGLRWPGRHPDDRRVQRCRPAYANLTDIPVRYCSKYLDTHIGPRPSSHKRLGHLPGWTGTCGDYRRLRPCTLERADFDLALDLEYSQLGSAACSALRRLFVRLSSL